MLGQVMNVLPHVGNHRVHHDPPRYLPVGAKNHVFHRVGEDGSGVAVLLTYGYPRLEALFTPVVGIEPVVRDVDQDVALPEVARQPAIALEVELDYPDPGIHRHIEGRQRLGIHGAVRRNAVTLLESGNCRRDLVVVYGLAVWLLQISGRLQPFAEDFDIGSLVAPPQAGDSKDRAPSALRL